MDTVYVVTSGDYSDYRICAVFSTKEQAERYIKVYETDRYDRHEIEEYTLEQSVDRVRYKASSGDSVGLWLRVYDRTEDDAPPPSECIRLWQNSIHKSVSYETIFEADDAEHARKIAGERIALAFSGQKVFPVVKQYTDNTIIGFAALERVPGGTHIHFVEEPITA